MKTRLTSCRSFDGSSETAARVETDRRTKLGHFGYPDYRHDDLCRGREVKRDRYIAYARIDGLWMARWEVETGAMKRITSRLWVTSTPLPETERCA